MRSGHVRRRSFAVPGVLAVVLAVGLSAILPSGAVQAIGETAQLITRIPTRSPLIALTFDAGSDAGHTQAILDILEAEGITATFFLTGSWLAKFPELGRAVSEAGHELGNHTYSHPHLTELTDAEIRSELTRTEEAAETLGRPLTPFFRPPYGEFDRRVSEVARAQGYRYLVMWTVDSWDWKLIPPDELTDRVVGKAAPGAVILLHVGSQTNTPTALPGMIERLRDQGYRFGTLSELLGDIPEGYLFHTVEPGDTLSGIAQRYGVTVAELAAGNRLDPGHRLPVGEALLIPDQDPDQGGHGSDDDWGPVTGGPGDDPGARPAPGDGVWDRLAVFFRRLGDVLLALVAAVEGLFGGG